MRRSMYELTCILGRSLNTGFGEVPQRIMYGPMYCIVR